MIAYILTHLWVFMEMLFLDILADAFLIKKKSGSRSKRFWSALFDHGYVSQCDAV
jgi:two-component system sensor histidine kinase AgrC